MKKILLRTIWLVTAVLLTTCNARLYTPIPTAEEPPRAAVLAHLRYLRGELEQGAGPEMQRLFPEGYFFTHVLYGLTWVDLALQEPAHQPTALAEARWALAKLDTPAGYAPFPAHLEPPYGMFYNAWRAYLLTGILLLQPEGERDTAEIGRYRAECAALVQAIADSPTPFLPSYTNQAWPVDTFPALVALRGHAQLLGDAQYEPLIAEWLAAVQTHLDPALGLVPHRTEATTGAMLDGARATSQTLILRWWLELDPETAVAHYATFRQQFVTTRVGIPGVLEFPPTRNGRGDIDSGPLLAGVSLSATTVMWGTARVYGDEALMVPLGQAGEALAWPLGWGGKRWYGFGLLPVGDAFAVWAQVATPWFTAVPTGNYGMIRPWWWRLPYHLAAVALLAVPWLGRKR
ncbi:MAG: hypothetical protein OT477_13645 [Chloroflexi bacterium]|nr:hypothetical protein [Chloroflexota bacterium]